MSYGYSYGRVESAFPKPPKHDPQHIDDTLVSLPGYMPAPVNPLSQITKQNARSFGFTGNACSTCGLMTMVRNGTCEKCQNCGTTTGCS